MPPVMVRQQVLHAAEELVQVERLGEILVGPQIEAPRPVLRQRPGTEHQHRHVATGGAKRLATV